MNVTGALKVELHAGKTLQELGSVESSYRAIGYEVFHVRGQFCTTWTDFYREISAALQFPWYCGMNSAALDECLVECGEDNGSAGTVLSLRNFHEFSAEANRREQLHQFEAQMQFIAGEMAAPADTTVGIESRSRQLVILAHTDSKFDHIGAAEMSLAAIMARVTLGGFA
ncbi:hypothetical protein GCM10027169_24420 [Gordonia jinhuaensis]|uniref:Barstar (barnase inhibitor) domain-containing protein n=1 Tax=Gordonia jinhuaensis TaxID=1517702 RepID=A0A916TDT0_9ACTN|nr:barstar family protein [Gordonia jinhuaensis]GGB39806.1 hypothetical protein GCM10011489_29300 [Gordonia jinhuaensis]